MSYDQKSSFLKDTVYTDNDDDLLLLLLLLSLGAECQIRI